MNSFGSQSTLKVGNKTYEIFRLKALEAKGLSLGRLPYSLRVLLENLLRQEDGKSVTANDIEFLAKWQAKAEPAREIAFMPARVLMQDFTGVPAIVDLAAMRDAMKELGGNPEKINPLQPAELVIDHSVQVDEFGTSNAYSINAALEFQRNRERYAFLKWGQTGFRNFSTVPPGMGICHQVNLEYLARVVFTTADSGGVVRAYPDTLVGTDSHTTMINGLGVLGWGVGGIEAEAAMLGQPVSMLVPQVVGFKLTGKLREGATATDLVLTVTEMLRKVGVVGKFVEFYGSGVSELSLAASSPLTPRPCVICGSRAAARSRSTWSKPTPRNRGGFTLRIRPRRSTRRRPISIFQLSSPALPVPSGHRTGCRFRRRVPASSNSCRVFWGRTPGTGRSGKRSVGKAKAVTPGAMARAKLHRKRDLAPRSRSALAWMSILTLITDRL